MTAAEITVHHDDVLPSFVSEVAGDVGDVHVEPRGPQMSEDEARRLTEAINTTITNLVDLVVVAYHRRAWAALGYSNWKSYVDAELTTSMFKFSNADRNSYVEQLRTSGLSIRGIAAALGTGTRQVQDALADAGEREVCSETNT